VRTLPQSPSLDYLKQQAKDLLAAIRETLPDASLSDAQKSLAKQYGFRNWTELKAEVERLRVKPEVADAEVVSGIAKSFDLGEVTAPAVIVAHEVMGPSLRLQTDNGPWFAHAVLPWVDTDQAEEAIRLMEAARSAGIKTPAPVRSIEGALVEEVGEHRWRVDEWMELGPSIAKPVSATAARKIGELLGTLHDLKLTPALPMSPWLAAERRSPERWQEILRIVEEAGMPWASALADALPAIIDISAVAVEPPKEDFILSLTNLVPAGIRVGKDSSLVPLGWEYAGAIPPPWEVGLVLRAWTEGVDDQQNLAAARPIIEGYAAVTGERPSRDVSIFSPTITASLNWLVSRMNYALEDEGDERERATKELVNMLQFPLTRDQLEQVLRAAA
jgi:hypothetical protein